MHGLYNIIKLEDYEPHSVNYLMYLNGHVSIIVAMPSIFDVKILYIAHILTMPIIYDYTLGHDIGICEKVSNLQIRTSIVWEPFSELSINVYSY